MELGSGDGELIAVGLGESAGDGTREVGPVLVAN
jgi:hypothetical protein